MMSENNSLPDIPSSWMWVKVGEVIDKAALTGKKLPRKNYQSEGKLPVIDQGQKLIGGYTDREGLKLDCEPPTIVFGDHTKAIKYIGFDFVAGADGVKVLKPWDIFYPKLFYYFLQGVALPDKGYARHFQFLEKANIPLPPLPEQHRIVTKVEELLTKLDAGIEELQKAKAQLKRYRQSMLKAAVTGELTKEWRETHQDELEPASELLARILMRRREKWEADQLAKMEAAGKRLMNDEWKKKYQEPAASPTSELPELPEDWAWATVEQLAIKVQYGTSAKANEDSNGVPVMRMGNIVNGKLISDSLKYLPHIHHEFPELLLKSGDVLFNRTNSAELVGKTAVYKGRPHPCSFASYLIRVMLADDYVPDLLAYYINSSFGRKWLASVVSQQVGQANVNGTKLQALSVPVPSLMEQQQIVSEVERLLSIADAMGQTIEQSLKQSERLRQSILKQAFEGQLVPQDPDDEPAEVLLARIREERERRAVGQSKKSKARGRRKDKDAQMKLVEGAAN